MRSFSLSLEVRIRTASERDLVKLEWMGMFTVHREIIRRTFAGQSRGEQVMLVADVNDHPIAQVWIDLARRSDTRTGYLWAVRVLPIFQRRGIAGRLLDAAESELLHRGYAAAELDVEKPDGPMRFYRARGYQVAGETIDRWVLRKALR